jgi:hypothetical protein
MNEERAQAALDAANALGTLLYEKQMAYGDAGGIQREIWQALLRQYEIHALTGVRENAGGYYVMPRELMDHIPRLTRVFDRICRIVSNPAGDRMGEDPWKDMAGDAIIGMIMPRTQPPQACGEPDCEIAGPHEVHGRVDARGVEWWRRGGQRGGAEWGLMGFVQGVSNGVLNLNQMDGRSTVGLDSPQPPRDPWGVIQQVAEDVGVAAMRAQSPSYTHGYTPEHDGDDDARASGQGEV